MKRIFINKSTAIILLAIGVISAVVSCSSGSDKLSLATQNSGEWTSLVDKTILEPERAVRVKQLGFRLFELADSASTDIIKLSENATSLSTNYQCTKEEWQKLFDEFTEIRKANFAKYRDVLFAMRKEVNEKEWKELTN